MNLNERNLVFRRAIHNYRLGDLSASAKDFRRLVDDGSTEPSHLSYYGLLTALAEGKVTEGRRFCERALHAASYDPTMYLNLANLHFLTGSRSHAVEILRRGLRVDPGNAGLEKQLQRINPRRKPTFDFLGRGHPVNRYAGLTRSRISRLLGKQRPAYTLA